MMLTNPPWVKDGRFGIRAGSRWPFTVEQYGGYLPYPFFLGYATSLLKHHGVDAFLYDAIAERHSREKYIDIVHQYAPAALIIESCEGSWAYDKETIDLLRKNGVEAKIIVCGPLTKRPEIEHQIIGEYEKSLLLEIAKITHAGKMPWPDRLSVDMTKYTDTFAGFTDKNIQFWSSRGCSFGCTFCVWPQLIYQNRKWIPRDLDDVQAEVEHVLDQNSWCDAVYFDDDTTNMATNHWMGLADRMGEIRVQWAAMCRADTTPAVSFEYAAKRGLKAVKFGVESTEIDCGKRLNIKKVEESIHVCKENGVGVHLTFVIGLPGETIDSINQTLEWLYKMDPTTKQVSYAAAYPGTLFYEQLDKEKLLGGSDPDGNQYVYNPALYGQKDRFEQAWNAFKMLKAFHDQPINGKREVIV